MVRVNCHIHSSESDGSLSPREIVKEAIRVGLDVICFTDHFKIPGEIKNYDDKRKHLDEYYDELNVLRREFKGKVEILIGVEADWIDGYEDWIRERVGRRDYDFVLGSVHWLTDPKGRLERAHYPEGDIGGFDSEKEFVEFYLVEVRKMVEWGVVDAVAHLDIFRKRLSPRDDSGEPDHPEILEEDWYRDLILDLLDLMKERGIALEINCIGWGILGEQFPQGWIIEEAVSRGIGLTLGNDFHKLRFGKLDRGIDKALDMLRDIECEEILVFRNRKGMKLRI